jgi:outer membrane protein
MKIALVIQLAAIGAALVTPHQTIAQTRTYSPSFDCQLATNATEQRICHNPNLSKLDRQLAVEYAQLLRSLDPTQQNGLKDREQEWMARRDACGANVPCISRAYTQRIEELHAGFKAVAKQSGTNGPSFDCRLATSITEQTICRSPNLSRLDRQLADAYARVFQSLDPAQQSELADREQDWIGQRDTCAADEPCISRTYTQRMAELRPGSVESGQRTTPVTLSGQAGIAVVDPQFLMQNADAAKDARARIEKMRASYQAEMKGTQDEIDKLGQSIAQQRSTLSQDAFRQRMQEFQKKTDDYRRELQLRDEKLNTALNAATLKMAAAIVSVVDELKSERKFALILTRSSIVGAANVPDVTAEVLKRMNQRMPAITIDLPR